MRVRVGLAACSLASAIYLGLAGARMSSAEPSTAATGIGKKIENFQLQDSSGKEWLWSELKSRQAVVVLFLGTECPVNNAYLPRLAELYQTFSPRGIQFVGINANAQDSLQRITDHVKEFSIPFPVLKDPDRRIADMFGAQRTPEAFLCDGEGRIRYRGRIDDQIGVGYRRPQPTRRDLAEALAELLAGKPVSLPVTTVAGCLIGRSVPAKPTGAVTYSKHISRILQNRCQECHRPGQIGPMALLTYEDVVAWSGMIREVIADKRMPPWHADPRHGKFTNDRSLSQEEQSTLLTWIEQGCAKGEADELPAPRHFTDDWRIGKPDVMLTMSREVTIPAKAPRHGIPYQYANVQTAFPEDVWVQAAEAKPGNRAVVHHIIVYVRRPGQRGQNPVDGIGDGFLVGYAPGDLPLSLPPGMAKRVPKGSELVFQLHYTPNGVEQTDRSSVGLIFAKGPPEHEVRTRSVAQRYFVIPPGAENHRVFAVSTFSQDALLVNLLPHMHLRGKSFEYRIVYADGRSETVLSVPRYDFSWQSYYQLTKPIPLPAGTRVECTAHFDNSADNPNNPDPKAPVRWGDQTWEEMMIGFVDYVYSGSPPSR